MNPRQTTPPFVLFAFVASILIGLATNSRLDAGSPIYVGQKTSTKVPIETIDHDSWNKLLATYVDLNGMVDYRAWKANVADRAALEQYLNTLSAANAAARAPKSVKLAFWINAYNAVTVHGILREYPTSSIRNHTAKLFGYNIWKDLQLYVGGHPYSLETIEHKLLRKMNEPRIHFAIVCASVGCPRLLNEAYVPAKLNEQLEANAKDFFSRKRNFQHDVSAGQFRLSEILDWFGEDFGDDQASQLKSIANWLPNPAAQNAAMHHSVRVVFIDYNWNLNSR
ncbi:DUF547 domain-containing protein [Planctomycetes bacterium K23_9]